MNEPGLWTHAEFLRALADTMVQNANTERLRQIADLLDHTIRELKEVNAAIKEIAHE